MTEEQQKTQQAIKVRQVTEAHTNFSEKGRGQPGKFSIQLILDNGAEEYVIRPPAAEMKVLIKKLRSADPVYFDMERRVTVTKNLHLGGG